MCDFYLKMGGLWKWFKANFIPAHIIFGYIFVMSGLVVCFFMLLTYIFVWPFSKTLYRKIVVHLGYLHWSQLTVLAQWWSGTTCEVYINNLDDVKYLANENSIAIMNHKYDIDWLLTWIVVEPMGLLGGTKIFAKSSLKMVPLLGWAWMFTESIFLKREWEKDKNIISRDLRYICDYPDGYWITLLLFCEGTRYTQAKHELANEVARQKGLPPLKHHLLPRTKGFVQTMHGLKGKVPSILDVTCGFTDDGAEPSLMNVIRGRACRGQMYVRRIPLDDVPTNTDEACAEWLHKLYQEKDEIFDNFAKNGRFTIGERVPLTSRYHNLLAFIMWVGVLCVPLFYYIGHLVMTASYTTQIILVAVTTISFFGVRSMIAVTEIHKASSSYGSKPTTSSNNNSLSK